MQKNSGPVVHPLECISKAYALGWDGKEVRL